MMKSHRAYSIRRAFQALLRSVLADGMFVALLIAPPLLGAALRFGLPALISAVPPLGLVANYKPLWDALLYLLTPYMTLFSSCMVALEERDNGVCLALVTTPLGKAGYLASRFLLPALFAALYSALCAAAFSSVPRPLSHTVMLSLPAAFTALTWSRSFPLLHAIKSWVWPCPSFADFSCSRSQFRFFCHTNGSRFCAGCHHIGFIGF